jgi:hypothetical protein
MIIGQSQNCRDHFFSISVKREAGIELFRTKKVYNYTCRLNEFSWQGRQFWNRTFEEEISKVDIAEIRQLIDENDENEEDEQC